ncbi:MAG: hypothetical protein JWP76_4422 [Dactylosporangium sp.]|jgi:hypothetical protein|nr:hypothetical protein [Dactylosporangium sp.]
MECAVPRSITKDIPTTVSVPEPFLSFTVPHRFLGNVV